jgi:hypothetical protein
MPRSFFADQSGALATKSTKKELENKRTNSLCFFAYAGGRISQLF